MSAFICSDYHISVLADFAASRRGFPIMIDGKEWRDREEIFECLHAENVRSVNYRYKENEAPLGRFDLRASAHSDRYSRVDIIKACHCLEYQSCETPDYRETVAFQLLEAIKSAAEHSLPGYDEAPWGLAAPAERKAKA